MFKLTQATLLVVILTAAPAAAQRFRLAVGGANFRPYPVACPSLTVEKGAHPQAGPELASRITTYLRSSVDMMRSLELVAPKTYLNADAELWTQPVYQNWSNVGASGLVRATAWTDGQQSRIAFRFYDVVSQRELLFRTYTQSLDASEIAVRRFLDELVELLTGEPGIFSSRIAFVKKTKQGKAVYVCDIDGSNMQSLTDPNALSLFPAWDQKGQAVLYTSYLKNNPDLYRLNLKTMAVAPLSNRRGLNTGASVSRDGRKIALTLSIDGNTEIYVMDADGHNLQRLTDSWGQDVSPTWSPDGKQIAFVSSRSGNPHIYTMSATGGEPRRLTFQGTYNQEPDWSPRADGQIVFTARDERLKFDIFLVNPANGEITRLTQDDGNNESPSHSPDGHHIVFTSTREGSAGRKLFMMDVDGRNQQRISRESGEYETPAWGPRLGYGQ